MSYKAHAAAAAARKSDFITKTSSSTRQPPKKQGDSQLQSNPTLTDPVSGEKQGAPSTQKIVKNLFSQLARSGGKNRVNLIQKQSQKAVQVNQFNQRKSSAESRPQLRDLSPLKFGFNSSQFDISQHRQQFMTSTNRSQSRKRKEMERSLASPQIIQQNSFFNKKTSVPQCYDSSNMMLSSTEEASVQSSSGATRLSQKKVSDKRYSLKKTNSKLQYVSNQGKQLQKQYQRTNSNFRLKRPSIPSQNSSSRPFFSPQRPTLNIVLPMHISKSQTNLTMRSFGSKKKSQQELSQRKLSPFSKYQKLHEKSEEILQISARKNKLSLLNTSGDKKSTSKTRKKKKKFIKKAIQGQKQERVMKITEEIVADEAEIQQPVNQLSSSPSSNKFRQDIGQAGLLRINESSGLLQTSEKDESDEKFDYECYKKIEEEESQDKSFCQLVNKEKRHFVLDLGKLIDNQCEKELKIVAQGNVQHYIGDGIIGSKTPTVDDPIKQSSLHRQEFSFCNKNIQKTNLPLQMHQQNQQTDEDEEVQFRVGIEKIENNDCSVNVQSLCSSTQNNESPLINRTGDTDENYGTWQYRNQQVDPGLLQQEVKVENKNYDLPFSPDFKHDKFPETITTQQSPKRINQIQLKFSKDMKPQKDRYKENKENQTITPANAFKVFQRDLPLQKASNATVNYELKKTSFKDKHIKETSSTANLRHQIMQLSSYSSTQNWTKNHLKQFLKSHQSSIQSNQTIKHSLSTSSISSKEKAGNMGSKKYLSLYDQVLRKTQIQQQQQQLQHQSSSIASSNMMSKQNFELNPIQMPSPEFQDLVISKILESSQKNWRQSPERSESELKQFLTDEDSGMLL